MSRSRTGSFKALSRMSSFPTASRAALESDLNMFQSAVAHELISNDFGFKSEHTGSYRFKALSRMSSFPTYDLVLTKNEVKGVSKRCRA